MSDFTKVLTDYDEALIALGNVYSELLGLAGSGPSKVSEAERLVLRERITRVEPAIKSLKGQLT